MTEYPIRDDLPVPEIPQGGRPRNSTKYPFDSMNVGDSFHADASLVAVRTAALRWRKNTDMSKKFVYKEEAGGTRCWREA